ncbi:MAG TPA: chitobiase/beta-hexosaminidase C-terminal domain-containing protein, partial [Opitutaceae bacterium]|nr:chitobiase/beta-hexosaminidase C-terminal domain-containing protein [Opitutaceae bacterium]
MKRILLKLLIVGALLATSCWRTEASGTWSHLTNPAPVGFSNCLLLSDGTLICAHSGSTCYRLTPDSHGSYANGTWSQIASMNNTRLFYASQVLTDGRVYVAGGEYGTGKGLAETYNPLTNVWTLTSPGPFSVISDAISALLPNGDVLQSNSQSSAAIYHPTTNTWSLAATPGDQNEADWVKLPDDSILTIIAYGRNTQRYIPSQDKWVSEPSVPVDMFNGQGELGSGHLLPNGKVFWLGGTGNTVIYTPTGNTNPGSWVTGPVLPNGDGANDAPAAMMANGRILCAFADSTTSFGTKTFFYEYDYATNNFTQIPDPNHTADLSDPIATYNTSMIDLPDGSVFYCGANSKSYIYTPDGSQLTTGKPVITSVTQNADGSYHLTGTGLTGLSEGAKYGDDKQMNTNYPIVHLTDNTTGKVYYARTYNWTSTGVMTGSTVITTEFTLPAGLPQDPYSLVVSANGLASAPVAFSATVNTVATPTFSPPAGTYASGQAVTISTSTSGASIRYTTDDSLPSETNGTLYSGPVSIITTTTLRAIAYETGIIDSGVASGLYTIGSGSITVSSGNGFDNTPMSSSQSGTFTATFDASPSLSPSNTVIALSKGAQTAYPGLACIARFNTAGNIDAYNGTAYQAASVIPYSKALTYHFRMVVNVPANTYSVYVTPPGGSELTVGLNDKFRTAVTSLDTWTIDVNATPGGSVNVSNHSVSGTGGTVAAPSFSPGAGTYTTAQTVLINDSTSGASIRYTTDGSTPSETAGTLYTGSISIGTTTTLKAIGYETGMMDSTVFSATYTISSLPPPPVISSAGTASGTVGAAFSYQITASHSPTSYGATGLPAGLSVDSSTGLISGTPDATGTSSVTLGATNAGGTGNQTLTLTVAPGTTYTNLWDLAGAADFNADGNSDLIWQSTSGQRALWLMNGTTYS